MLLLDGSLVFSATDLSGFLDCGHLPTLERAAARGQLAKPPGPHPLSADYGDRHEADYLRRLRAGGLRVAELDRPASHGRDDLAAAQRETVAALAEGYDVVYQGTLFDGTWLGHPDFLVRVDGRSGHWPHAYDVVDTKLARRAKATALLQVALYGQLLAPLQGTEPGELILALGDGTEERFPYAGAAAYLRAIQARFVEALAADPPYPYPVEHCALCRWDGHCAARRRGDDHLSLIAGISHQQVRRLEVAGVATVAALADDPLPPGLRIGRGALDRLRRQAAEQVRSRDAGRLSYTRRPAPAGQGLDALPPPDDGDLFFDMEGFPYAEDGGLEYLFGWVDAAGTFHHRFAEDRPGERRAFEQFMDELAGRRRRHPGLHVYHYASYERSALSRLSNRHGVREEEVADLLRQGILVDLYRVVRQALVVGAESYSIKYLEPLYGLQRTGEVRSAAESLEMYQEWLDSDPRDEAIRARIAAYNEVDCRSTLRLRDWLLTLPDPDPAVTTGSVGPVAPAGRPAPRGPSEKLAAWLALVEGLADRLLVGLAEDPAARDPEQQGRAVLAHLLRFHQREDNAQWRDYFARLELSVDELRDDDHAAVADLRFEELGPAVRRSQDHVYSFPAQEVGLRVGDRPVDPTTGNAAGSLVSLEAPAGDGEDGSARGRLVLRRALTSEVPHPPALVPPGPIENDVLRQALVRLAEWVLANGVSSPLPGWRGARQLLLRRPPRLRPPVVAGPDGRLAGPDEHGAEALLRLAPALDGASLPVQGPPGSGKTYSSARVIVDAVARGGRVGVTANSHRVIENLLVAVVAEGNRRGIAVQVARKGDGDRELAGIETVAGNEEISARLADGRLDVVGATAWVMARPEMAGLLDLLVVDEAGQVSLANALASMGAATDTVLVGDPAQLDQPVQAAHPEGTEVSALAHFIGPAATMPGDLGLFLDRTRRMHPSICRFVSEVVYDGKLSGIDGLDRQSVTATDPAAPLGRLLSGAGLRWLPVAHQGNRNASVEEADRIAEAVDQLIGGTWTDTGGTSRRLAPGDILVVSPYNAQIATLQSRLPDGVAVGTVDRFQGREAPVVFYSMATSTVDDLPRDFEFLFSLNRLNVAVSRAKALAVLVCSPALRAPRCRTTRQIRLVNALCRLIEYAEGPPP